MMWDLDLAAVITESFFTLARFGFYCYWDGLTLLLLLLLLDWNQCKHIALGVTFTVLDGFFGVFDNLEPTSLEQIEVLHLSPDVHSLLFMID